MVHTTRILLCPPVEGESSRMKYISPTTPKAHQLEYRKRVASKPCAPSDQDVFAVLAEMGTGKSKMVLDEWQDYVAAGRLENLVVVAPKGSYRNWFEDRSADQPSEMRRHLDPALFERVAWASWVSGGGKRARAAVDNLLRTRGRPRALFVNTEAMSTVDDCILVVSEFVEMGPTMAVVDESTMIKSPKADRTKNVVRATQGARVKRILTGLVTPRSPLDLFSQFEFLDWRILGFKSYYAFRAVHAVLQRMEVGGRRFDVVVGYRNVDELRDKIAPYSYRVLKEDCLDLDPKTYVTRDVELTKEQKKRYAEVKLFATTQLSESAHVVATSVITQMIRLHQIVCGHAVDENGVIHDVPSKRPKAVLNVLEEHAGKAIVWVTYRHELKKIADAIRKEYKSDEIVAEFHGGNISSRGDEERRFLSDPRCRFMLSTQQAGGRGNTWVVADLVIYAANSHDLEMRMQSEDRTHRQGQTKPVTYVDLVADGTVEGKIIKSLRNKINMATEITGENYREWII